MVMPTHRGQQRLNPSSIAVEVAHDPHALIRQVEAVGCLMDLHPSIMPVSADSDMASTTQRGECETAEISGRRATILWSCSGHPCCPAKCRCPVSDHEPACKGPAEARFSDCH